MNRRDFFGHTAGVVLFGATAKHAQAGAHFGRDAPPADFPEFNWIQFQDAISGIVPMRGDHLVSCADGLYRLRGCEGPFKIDERDPRRLWIRHVRWDMTQVELWHRH